MKIKRSAAFFLFFLLNSSIAFSQSITELYQQLAQAKSTIAKIDLYNRIAYELRASDPDSCINVANRTLQLAKQLFTVQGDGIFRAPSHGDGQRARIEKQVVERAVGLLRHHSRGALAARHLDVRAVLALEQTGGNAHVVQECRGILLLQAGLICLPAEAAYRRGLLFHVPDVIRLAVET